MSETNKARKNTVDPSILSNHLAPVAASTASNMVAPVAAEAPRLPSDKTLQHACRLAIEKDMPILMDYWKDSFSTAFIGVYSNNLSSKLLVKSDDEYTSNIQKMMRSSSGSSSEYIVMTENSIYIVSATIKQKRIS